MKPRLLRSELTGQVYVVTRYKVDPKSGLIQAQTKCDVTDEFNGMAKGVLSDDDLWVLSTALSDFIEWATESAADYRQQDNAAVDRQAVVARALTQTFASLSAVHDAESLDQPRPLRPGPTYAQQQEGTP